MGLAENLRYVRESQGFSRRDLADQGGTTYGTIAAIENKRLLKPDEQLVRSMAEVLGVSMEELTTEDPLDEISRLYRDVRRRDDRVLTAWANKSIADVGRILRCLVSGDFVSPVPPSEDLVRLELEWLTALVGVAQISVDATSCMPKENWWDSNPGRVYLQKNVDLLIERSVVVRRIFVFEDEDDLRDQAQQLHMQRTLGIDVRYLVLSDERLVPEDRRLLLHVWDMALIDEGWLIYLPYLSRQQMLPSTQLTRDQSRILSAKKAFGHLWTIAKS